MSTGTSTIYAGNHVYEGTTGSETLKFFAHPEGYVDVNAGTYKYVYQYKDHLGNIRLSYSDMDGNGQISASAEILEENNYYPFGLKHKGYNDNPTSSNVALKRKFGGNELQDELGLDWYDITARNYDPALGRWMNLDPLAEMMRRHSPYNYAFNNPIFFIDPDGMSPVSILMNGGSITPEDVVHSAFGNQQISTTNISISGGYGGGGSDPKKDSNADPNDIFRSAKEFVKNLFNIFPKSSEEAEEVQQTREIILGKGDNKENGEDDSGSIKSFLYNITPDAAEANFTVSYTFKNHMSVNWSLGIFTEAHPGGDNGYGLSFGPGLDTSKGFSYEGNLNFFYAKNSYNNGSYLTLNDLTLWEDNASIGYGGFQLNGIKARNYWAFGFGISSTVSPNFSYYRSFTPTINKF